MKYLVSYSYRTGAVVGTRHRFVTIPRLTEESVTAMQEGIREADRADGIVIMNLVPLTGER